MFEPLRKNRCVGTAARMADLLPCRDETGFIPRTLALRPHAAELARNATLAVVTATAYYEPEGEVVAISSPVYT